jgi:hypothetical protein
MSKTELRSKKFALRAGLVVAALVVAFAAGCLGPVPFFSSHGCASGPARPISVARAVDALRASGLAIERDGDQSLCTSRIVATFTDKASATFCDVEKASPPRMRDAPDTIFSGKNVSGKAAEVEFQNVDCVLYGSRSMDRRAAARAALAAMLRLGGTKLASF